MNPIAKLFNPRSVAVIGASSDAAKTAGRPIFYLRKQGFTGKIYPVNPRADVIDDLLCYPGIASLPEVPDVAIVLLGADRAQQAVHELAALGTPAAIVLASGYTETGPQGALRQQALLDAAGSMRILGPNTIGLVNVTDNIPLSASGALAMEHFLPGSIGVVSQSGGILGALLSRATAQGIGLSKLVSTSNEADLELADFIDYLVDDPATDVIALYIETVRYPDKFRAAALKARRAGKPIVAFKIGRSEAGAMAAVSHTGAMSGSDRMYDALFQETGVIRAQRFSDLLDMAAALSTGRVLRGRRVAILTSTGGAGTLVTDSLGVSGFETPAPDEATAARLRALQTGSHAVLDRNPIDVTLAGLEPSLLRGAIRALLDSPSYDALAVVIGSSSLAQPELMSSAIKDCLSGSEKPVIAFVSPHAPHVVQHLNTEGVPAYPAPESCTAAFLAMMALAEQVEPSLPESARPRMHVDISDFAAGSLDEAEAKHLFSRFAIPTVRETIVRNADQARAAVEALGPHVVLKMLSNEITHKSEVGGVAVNVDATSIEQRLADMAREVAAHTGATPTRYVVQEMIEGGIELILGLHKDPLGTAILLGMGGVTAELFNDSTLHLLPPGRGLTMAEAIGMMRKLKTWPLLDGYRGRAKADTEAMAAAMVAFSEMARCLGDRLLEAEINPVFVLAQGQGVRAADGVVVLA